MTDESCSNCHYARFSANGVYIECHKNPPVYIRSWGWPVVGLQDWCGEWESNEGQTDE